MLAGKRDWTPDWDRASDSGRGQFDYSALGPEVLHTGFSEDCDQVLYRKTQLAGDRRDMMRQKSRRIGHEQQERTVCRGGNILMGSWPFHNILPLLLSLRGGNKNASLKCLSTM